ncbi:unnamed protein product [Amoebophrya sp. A25]|nr:unnamed protein product [Amoebophrya sp. A25]|eukprot:GSA25T00014216001.1
MSFSSDSSSKTDTATPPPGFYSQSWMRGGDAHVGEEGVDFSAVRSPMMGNEQQFSEEAQQKAAARMETVFGSDSRCNDGWVYKKRHPNLVDMIVESAEKCSKREEGDHVGSSPVEEDETFVPADKEQEGGPCIPYLPLQYPSVVLQDPETKEDYIADKLWVSWSDLRRKLWEVEREVRSSVLKEYGLVREFMQEAEVADDIVTGEQDESKLQIVDRSKLPTAPKRAEVPAVVVTATPHLEYYEAQWRETPSSLITVSVPRGTRAQHRRARMASLEARGRKAQPQDTTALDQKYEEAFDATSSPAKKLHKSIVSTMSTRREEAALDKLEGVIVQRQKAVVSRFLFDALRVVELEELITNYWDQCMLGVITILHVSVDYRLETDTDYGALAYLWRVLDTGLTTTHADIVDTRNVAEVDDVVRFHINDAGFLPADAHGEAASSPAMADIRNRFLATVTRTREYDEVESGEKSGSPDSTEPEGVDPASAAEAENKAGPSFDYVSFFRWLWSQHRGAGDESESSIPGKPETELLQKVRASLKREVIFRFADTRGRVSLYDDTRLGQPTHWERVIAVLGLCEGGAGGYREACAAVSKLLPRGGSGLSGEAAILQDEEHSSEKDNNTINDIEHYLDQVEGEYLWWPVSARRIYRSYRRTLLLTATSPPEDQFGRNAFHQVPEDTSLARVTAYLAHKDDKGDEDDESIPQPVAEVDPLALEKRSKTLDDSSSHLARKQAFRVYVYDVDDPRYYPELPLLNRGAHYCRDVQRGFDVQLHHYFLSCHCRTLDPRKADFFFVPQLAGCHFNLGTFNYTVSDQLFRQLIPKLEFFPRNTGRDHIFVWSGGEGADGPMRSWRDYIDESIFIMNEPEMWNYFEDWQKEGSFNFAKDILVPPQVSVRELEVQLEMNEPVRDRAYTADFIGWNRKLHKAIASNHEGPRGTLLRWMREDRQRYDKTSKVWHGDLHIAQDVPFTEGLYGQAASLFCLIPRGISGYTSRFIRALWAGCVPVILSDLYEVPFGHLFPEARVYPWFVKWPMRAMEGKPLARRDIYRSSDDAGPILSVLATAETTASVESTALSRDQYETLQLQPRARTFSLGTVRNEDLEGIDSSIAEDIMLMNANGNEDLNDKMKHLSLVGYLRSFTTSDMFTRYRKNAERIRCNYMYWPSVLDTGYEPGTIFRYLCGPRWHRKSAYRAIHKILYAKKLTLSTTPPDTFYLAPYGSDDDQLLLGENLQRVVW